MLTNVPHFPTLCYDLLMLRFVNLFIFYLPFQDVPTDELYLEPPLCSLGRRSFSFQSAANK